MIIDAHNHLVMSHAGWDGAAPRALPLDAICDRLQRGGVAAVGLVVGGDRAFPQTDVASPWIGTLDVLAQFWRGISAMSDEPVVIHSAEDIDRISPDRPGFLLGIEGIGPCFDNALDDPIAGLHLLAKFGVRSLQLVGGDPRPIFVSCGSQDAPLRLSAVGRRLIAEANRLGLLIDLSHMNGDEPAFEEILEASSSPPIASHHSCRCVNGLDGALSDGAIRALADAGGVIGIHSGSQWLSGEDRQGTIGDLLAQIVHVVDLVDVDSVGLGTDHIDIAALPNQPPPDLFMARFDGPESLGMVETALRDHGFGEDDRRKILGENVLRVWRGALGRGKKVR